MSENAGGSGGEPSGLPVPLSENVAAVTRAREKQKERQAVQKALMKQKKDYAAKEERFKRREENLRKKDLELQEALVLFDTFLNEKAIKKKRADDKAEEEMRETAMLEQRIAEREKLLAQRQQELVQVQRKLKSITNYQRYLEKLFQSSEAQFDSVASIQVRYETLEDAFKDLEAKEKAARDAAEAKRLELAEYRKQQYNRQLILNTEIARYSKDLDRVIEEGSQAEDMTKTRKEQEAKTKRLITQLVYAVDNLYSRVKYGRGYGNRKPVNLAAATDKSEVEKLEDISPTVSTTSQNTIEEAKFKFGGLKYTAMYEKKSKDEREAYDRLRPLEQLHWRTTRKLEVIRCYLVDFRKMLDDVRRSFGINLSALDSFTKPQSRQGGTLGYGALKGRSDQEAEADRMAIGGDTSIYSGGPCFDYYSFYSSMMEFKKAQKRAGRYPQMQAQTTQPHSNTERLGGTRQSKYNTSTTISSQRFDKAGGASTSRYGSLLGRSSRFQRRGVGGGGPTGSSLAMMGGGSTRYGMSGGSMLRSSALYRN